MLQIITATITFLLLDALWLGVLAKKIYIEAFGSLLRLSNGNMEPYWPAAVVVYIALLVGLLIFVLPRAGDSLMQALFFGALYGFVTYATYDFTNLAVLSQWSLRISVIDTIWGMCLCGLTSFVTVLITKKL